MADITSNVTKKEQTPHNEVTAVVVETPSTADDTDTFDIDLSDVGITELLGVQGYNSSSYVAEDPGGVTVSNGVATVTIGGSTDNEKRTYILYGV